MENKYLNTAQKLLMMEEDTSPEISSQSQENIIPPIGIARPEIINAYMENLGDEEKIKNSVKNIEEYYRENPLQTAEREAKSYGLRALEGLGGSVGGLLNLLSGEAYFNDEGELLKTKVPMLPSASELREFTKEKTGGKYEPRTEFAKEAHEAITDVGAAIPLPGSWFQKLLTPAGGQVVKSLFKHQGASESQADKAKLGFMMLSSISKIGNAPQLAKNAYHEAVQMIPQGTRMSTKYLSKELNALKNKPWYKTGKTTAKGPAFEEIDRIEKAMQYGSMDMHEAMQIRKDINEARKKLGAFNYEPGIDKPAARKYLNEVDDVLRNNMERWGQANNPKWNKAYETANQAYGVTQRSIQLQDYISQNAIGKALQSETTKIMFHLGGASALMHTPALAAAAVPLVTTAKSIQIMNRMIRSPLLRNHYLEVLKAASVQNAGAMNRALMKFDKEAQKMENKKNK